MNYCPWELNQSSGGIAILGLTPGFQELRERRPFVEFSPSGSILHSVLTERGLARKSLNLLYVNRNKESWKDLERELKEMRSKLQELQPRLVLTLGNEASWSLIPNWPSRDGTMFTSTGIQELRGFVFDSDIVSCPVLPSIQPEEVLKSWLPWRVLLSLDVQRAKDLAKTTFTRPVRNVEIVL